MKKPHAANLFEASLLPEKGSQFLSNASLKVFLTYSDLEELQGSVMAFIREIMCQQEGSLMSIESLKTLFFLERVRNV
jgi:hypothetical protein